MYHDVQVYYLRASSEVERQRWVTALTLAKAKAVKDLESGIFNTHQFASMHCSCSQHIGIMQIDDGTSVSRSIDIGKWLDLTTFLGRKLAGMFVEALNKMHN